MKLTGEAAKNAMCRAILAADDGRWGIIQDETRTLEQNALLHPLLTDISKQSLWMGKKRPMLQWKVIMVSAHAIATGAPAEMVIGIEGEVVNLRESTTAMSVKRFNSLIEYVLAWGAMNGVVFGDEPQRMAA